MHALQAASIELVGVQHDSRLYSYLLDPTYSSHGLPEVALRRLNLKLSGNLAESADITGRLVATLGEEVDKCGLRKLYEDIDLPLLPVLARMEDAGVKIDREALAQMSSRLEREIDAKAKEVYECCGAEFNINSPRQLGDVLFNKLNLPKPVKYGKGKTISTAVDVLEGLAANHEAPRLVLEYRQLSKLKSTYVDALPSLLNAATERLHTTFDQAGTATGRLSSANPNLQNIPIRTDIGKRVRRAFIAREGAVLLSADYSQIELRVLAHMANDPTLLEAFERGEDPHAVTAAEVLGIPFESVTSDHRRVAKMVNYGVLYGMSDFGLAERTGLPPAEASGFIQRYFERFSTVRDFQDDVIRKAEQNGYAETLLGRRRYFPEIRSHLYAVRQVHDELLLEGPREELLRIAPELCRIMSGAMDLRVPLQVDLKLGANWEDMNALQLAHA
jgi:DNA polymerase-1